MLRLSAMSLNEKQWALPDSLLTLELQSPADYYGVRQRGVGCAQGHRFLHGLAVVLRVGGASV